MNVPSVYKRALDGFLIPPRTFPEMLSSAAMGFFSLFNEESRASFLNNLEKGVLNEAIIAQASMSPLVMLSLFHELENPIFKQNKFEASEFLEGVAPALENFHNISGALDNQLRTKFSTEEESFAPESSSSNESEKDENEQRESGDEIDEDREAILTALRLHQPGVEYPFGRNEKYLSEVLSNDWTTDAEKDPESLAAQLSRMVTTELFQLHQVGAKTAFLLQAPHGQNMTFQEGSCAVSNVALLSARACFCVPQEPAEGVENDSESSPTRYEAVDYSMDEKEMKEKNAAVAAQVDLLYEVTQNISLTKIEEATKPEGESAEESKVEAKSSNTPDETLMEHTIVNVATVQGWLKDGPNGELRWQLALLRPPVEFPSMNPAY